MPDARRPVTEIDYERFISLEHAAKRLDTSTRTIRRRIADGTLSGYRLANSRAVRVAESDVTALLRPIPTVGGAA